MAYRDVVDCDRFLYGYESDKATSKSKKSEVCEGQYIVSTRSGPLDDKAYIYR